MAVSNRAFTRARNLRNHFGLFSIILAVFLITLGVLYAVADWTFRSSASASAYQSTGVLYRTLIEEVFLNPWFYAVYGIAVILERLVPARKEQSVLTAGLRQDILWLFFKTIMHSMALPLYLVLLRHLYNKHLGFLTIDSLSDSPWLARFFLALLFGDFIFWVTHLVWHKVVVFWHFHAVHHSQRELNFFTEYRVHPIDDLIIFTIGFIPIFMVEQSFITILAIVWIRHWHTRLYHCNIRSNFGFLRYVLVTPQSHRIHHSIKPKHRDKNFGLTFSLWDHLFRTQYRNYDEYPETGISDPAFPLEEKSRGLETLNTFVAQLFYPFQAIARSGRRSATQPE